ncbi:MAG: N-acetylglucosamine-6-phosphate deacetylase [Acholeplasmataceae bacterium]|jgi:N-acetylglucosamine-6-phosphate deacetylase|nr:N-acetylglucosamine-6-phosphate deacetylase [Acholeplasmataceae bacterium]
MEKFSGYIVLEDSIVYGKLIIKNGKIKDIVSLKEDVAAPKTYIMAGFIDQHIHGASGCDAMDATFNSINTISKAILKEGVTSFLATTMTASSNSIEAAINNVVTNKDKVTGANLLGVHLEGPFISPKYKGAQPEEHIIPFDLDKITKWNQDNIIKIVTVAPEIDDFHQLIDYAKSHNMIVSFGHTAATYRQTIEAIKQGGNGFTHAFNAMASFTHREVGVVGAMLESKDTYAELIADGIHVSPPAVKLLINNKGLKNIILISDAMRGKWLPDGISELGGQKVIIKDGTARLESGNLAGSVLKFNDALRNISNWLDLSLIDLSRISSLNAAINLGISDAKGSIAIGKDADLVMLDKDFNVLKTMVGGKVLYESKSI